MTPPWAQACNGGSWNNGANAGLGAINLNNPASNANWNIGARPANDSGQKPCRPRAHGQSPSFGASVLSLDGLEDQQPSACDTLADGDLYQRIASWGNLVLAYEEARRGKRYAREVLDFSARWEERLIELHEHLLWRSWQPGHPRRFWVRDPKWREITAPPFADRIVHHALVRVVDPLFERRFIFDSYACRRGKGVHAAVRRAQHFLRRAKRRWGDGIYIVHADVKSYFQSIDHQVAMQAIASVTSDPLVLWLWQQILGGYGYAGVGLPVGALTSQLVANAVLDRVDHAIKDDLGEPFYLRYMDDMVVICRDKAHARTMLERIADECAKLKLRLNPKSRYEPWQRGLDFCGYRIWPTHILPRKRNIRRWRARFKALRAAYAAGHVDLKDVRQMVKSCAAYLKHASAHQVMTGMLKDLVLTAGARI
ncbi:reverse transcriptase/maturase family protein [Pelomicrobium methylotrophicum]|uniref:Alpha/beta hydrolase n=1 Tax=Pelomicrobium methylotrophicum TaxID=2602750 RepID=A0A5C7EV39_9PROT|nr:reverse transcriptase/maturase family protein [Pelomicrobium methylotrophicum]TXF11947.1 alpha/beta hydrolase [Pelomicrobium methylotrophicum]